MDVYDYPRYCDIEFSWDPSREIGFLESCFKRYGLSHTRTVLELGCGTGRLLIELVKKGYRVVGIDKSHPMIQYLSEKARRQGISIQLVEADMEDFYVSEKVDAAFCAINTFRYLLTEKAMANHLRCVENSMMPGGVYIIDFNLVGLVNSYPKPNLEEWTADEKGVSVKVSHRFIGFPDIVNRRAVGELSLTVKEGDATRIIRTEESMRTYTREEFESLVEDSKAFKTVAWHGPNFNIDKRNQPGPDPERVVVVLKSF
jgi:SAM-dependent methyltransferase